jgi:CHAD domain-containing protein
MTMRQTVERELKLSAPPGFRLPDLPGEPLPRQTFSSAYFDSPDHRLARAGVTLRRRVENRRGLWQLKLPHGLARLELEIPGGPGPPPADFLRLLPAYLRGAEVGPSVTLRTKRSGTRTAAEAGAVADVTLDVVGANADGHSLGTFREIEIELVEGNEKGLRKLERALRAAGAQDGETRPKALQVLDLSIDEPPARPGPKAPAASHIAATLQTHYRAMLAHDPGTRLGHDIEELHQMRVSTRRLRAFLRAARPVLDPAWAQPLEGELAWIGAALGPTRDLDVLLEQLHADAELLDPKEQRTLRRVFHHLEGQRAAARSAMIDALESRRYIDALNRLEPEIGSPRLLQPDVSLPDLAAREFARLRKAARAVNARSPDDDLHELRIRGKRARYSAELAEATRGKPATKFISEAKTFQDVLGEHQDAAVAEERLRAMLRDLGGTATAFAIGRLVEHQRERKLAARKAYAATWKALARRGAEAWH